MDSLGYALYQAYTEALAEQNCSVDAWEALSEQDKANWEVTAQLFTIRTQGAL